MTSWGAGEPGPVSFGALLRAMRDRAGLTQEELAERAGLTAHGVSALERAVRTRPYPHTVRSLAVALGASVEETARLLAAVPRRPAGRVLPDAATAPNGASDPSGAEGRPSGGDVPSGQRRRVGDGPPEPPEPSRPGAADARTTGPAHASLLEVGGSSGQLPAATTRLVGRDADLALAAQKLGDGARLLTLTGLGGVGKTRLAVALAQSQRALHDAVVFVPLAPVDDAALLLPAVGRALGLTSVEGVGSDAKLLDRLREESVLLVLDNLEHLRGAADVVAGLLAGVPSLTVLATSRSALRVRGEVELAVHPLALPAAGAVDLSAVAASPAGALLLTLARAVSPGFGTRPGDGPAVAAICNRLAGIPLALELAAARARVLDADSLLLRLDDALTRPGAGDLPPRQRTMRATLDWSHGLLQESERTLLRRLSVFVGGFTVEAAEAVAGDLPDPLGALERLVEQSLLTVTDPATGPRRFGMLEPVLEHARSLLSSEEDRLARDRAAEHLLDLAERAAPALLGRDQVEWLHRLGVEDNNLASTADWLIANGDERAGRMVWALWLYWWLRGHPRRGRRLAEAAAAGRMSDPVLVRAQLAAATMCFASEDIPAATGWWAQAYEVAERIADPLGASNGIAGLGLAAMSTGDFERAEQYFRGALARLDPTTPMGDWLDSLVHVWLGTLRLLADDAAGAVPLVERGVASARARGDRLTTYVGLYGLVQAALAQGRAGDARAHLEEGLRLSEVTGDRANTAYMLESLAVVDELAGHARRCAVLLGAADALRAEVGSAVHSYYHPDPVLRQRAEAGAVASLGRDAFEDALDAGRAMPLPEAVALGLTPALGA